MVNRGACWTSSSWSAAAAAGGDRRGARSARERDAAGDRRVVRAHRQRARRAIDRQRRGPCGAAAPRRRRRRRCRPTSVPAPGCGSTPTSTATWPATTAASGPHRRRRAAPSALDRIRRLVAEAADAGVREVFLTGGEPFLLPDLDRIVRRLHRPAAHHAAHQRHALPRHAGSRMLRAHAARPAHPPDQPRLRHPRAARPPPRPGHLAAGPRRHPPSRRRRGLPRPGRRHHRRRTSRHRRSGRVPPPPRRRSASPGNDQVIRPVAQRGFADDGLALTVETLIPEVTVTADGVYWHPVAADHDDQLVTRELVPAARGHRRGSTPLHRIPAHRRRRRPTLPLRLAAGSRKLNVVHTPLCRESPRTRCRRPNRWSPRPHQRCAEPSFLGHGGSSHPSSLSSQAMSMLRTPQARAGPPTARAASKEDIG